MKTKTNYSKREPRRLKLLLLTAAFFLLMTTGSFAQTGGAAINATNADPDPSAMLDISSISKGLLIPRMTETQKLAIASPAPSLLIYQTDGTPGYYYNSGTALVPAWTMIGGGGGGGASINCNVTASNIHTLKLYTHYTYWGWNGMDVTLSVGGTPVPALTNISIPSGGGMGPVIYTFTANTGDIISTAVANPDGYNYYMIYDAYNNLIGMDGSPYGYLMPTGLNNITAHSKPAGDNTDYAVRGNGTGYECVSGMQISTAGKVGINTSANSSYNLLVNGNVGIGDLPSSAYKLSVDGIGHFTDYVGIGMNPNSYYGLRVASNVGIGSSPNYSYELSVDGDGHFTGNVGIGHAPDATYSLYVTGTTYLSDKLTIYSGGANISGSVTCNSTIYANMFNGDVTASTVTAGTVKCTTVNAGTITGSPTCYLGSTSVSSLKITGSVYSQSGSVMVINSSGTVGKGSTITTSSIRYKKDVKDLPINNANVLKLRPRSFVYKENNQPEIGLIAEEVEKLVPDLVIYHYKSKLDANGKPLLDKDGWEIPSDVLEPEAVKYDKLSVLLLGVLREQDAIIKEMQAAIKRQQEDIEALRANGNKPDPRASIK
jgi:hypothetical protein